MCYAVREELNAGLGVETHRTGELWSRRGVERSAVEWSGVEIGYGVGKDRR